MSATVIPLSSRGRYRAPAEGCASCQHRRDGQLCYPHRVAAASERLAALLDNTEGALLVEREVVARCVAEAGELLDTITAECRPEDVRSTAR